MKMINLDDALKSDKEILKAYKALAVNRNIDEVIYHGEAVQPDTIVNQEPPYAVHDGILPERFQGIETDTDLDEVMMSFRSKIDYQSEKLHFEGKGFTTIEHAGNLYVLNKSNEAIARYQKNQVAISIETIDQYIANMQDMANMQDIANMQR